MTHCASFPFCSILFCVMLQNDLKTYIKQVNEFYVYFYVVA